MIIELDLEELIGILKLNPLFKTISTYKVTQVLPNGKGGWAEPVEIDKSKISFRFY